MPGRRRRRGRLAVRLTLAFLFPTAIGLGAIGVLADHVAQQMLEDQLAERLIAIAHAERTVLSGIFADQLKRVDAADTRSLDRLRRRVLPIAQDTGVRRVFIIDAVKETSIVDTDPTIPFGHRYYELEADSAELDLVRKGESVASVMYTTEDGTPYKYAYVPVYDDETAELIAIIGVEGSSTQLDDLRAFRRNLAWLGLVALVLVLGIAIVVSRYLTAPVYQLVEAATRIGQGELEAPVAQTRNDELGELEQSIDAMRLGLRDRDEEMQMMLTGIAHEVRNPLGGIELFLGLLDEDLAADMRDDDPRREHVSRIARELEYLARVVNEFLEFARRRPLDVSRFGASAFVEEIVEVMESDARGADVRLVAHVEDAVELTADRDRIRRVVVNLVRNACQASDGGGGVEIKVSAPSPSMRRVDVIDHGVGIPAAKQAQIFRPFFTTREKGTGLGLPLTRKIVEAHGGTVAIDSVEGEGTTITLHLPFDKNLSALAAATTDIPEGWLG